MREPGMILRREAQAGLGRTAERAAHQHTIDAIALVVVGQAVACEGEKHGEGDEALLAVQQRDDAAWLRGNGYDAEIETLFGNVFFIGGIAG